MNNFSTSDSLFSKNLSLNLGGSFMSLSTPKIMGILNTTPDSFYAGSRVPEPGQAVERAREMIEQGADILDIGAVSSRPGSEDIPESVELDRFIPVLEALREAFPEFPLSIDTWRSGVARSLREQFGINMVNDISAGEFDLGISICGTGNGINMVVNKHQGIRGALCWNEEISRLARAHNDANICAIPGRFVNESEACLIVKAFLTTSFEGGRHKPRIDKIALKMY